MQLMTLRSSQLQTTRCTNYLPSGSLVPLFKHHALLPFLLLHQVNLTALFTTDQWVNRQSRSNVRMWLTKLVAGPIVATFPVPCFPQSSSSNPPVLCTLIPVTVPALIPITVQLYKLHQWLQHRVPLHLLRFLLMMRTQSNISNSVMKDRNDKNTSKQ